MVEVQPSLMSTTMEYSLSSPPVFEPPMVHPALIGMGSSCQEALNSGYSACAEEAERYLVEEEHFAPDDPVVVGLREHLRQQQQIYAIRNIFHQLSVLANVGEELDDSGVSLNSDQETVDDETDDMILQDCDRQSGTKTTLNMAAISNIAEEIISLLGADDSISDLEDEYSIPEQ